MLNEINRSDKSNTGLGMKDKIKYGIYRSEQLFRQHPVATAVGIGLLGLHLSAQLHEGLTNPRSGLATTLSLIEEAARSSAPGIVNNLGIDIRYLAEIVSGQIPLKNIEGPSLTLFIEMVNKLSSAALLGGSLWTVISNKFGPGYEANKLEGKVPASRFLPIDLALIGDPTVANWYMETLHNLKGFPGGSVYINPNGQNGQKDPNAPGTHSVFDFSFANSITNFDQPYLSKSRRTAANHTGLDRAKQVLILSQSPANMLYPDPSELVVSLSEMGIFMQDMSQFQKKRYWKNRRLTVSHPDTGIYPDGDFTDSMGDLKIIAQRHGAQFTHNAPEDSFRAEMHRRAVENMPPGLGQVVDTVIFDRDGRKSIERMADALSGDNESLENTINTSIFESNDERLDGRQEIIVYGSTDQETLRQVEAIVERNSGNALVTVPVIRDPSKAATYAKMGIKPYVIIEGMVK